MQGNQQGPMKVGDLDRVQSIVKDLNMGALAAGVAQRCQDLTLAEQSELVKHVNFSIRISAQREDGQKEITVNLSFYKALEVLNSVVWGHVSELSNLGVKAVESDFRPQNWIVDIYTGPAPENN